MKEKVWQNLTFKEFDLHLEQMTLILKLDLDVSAHQKLSS